MTSIAALMNRLGITSGLKGWLESIQNLLTSFDVGPDLQPRAKAKRSEMPCVTDIDLADNLHRDCGHSPEYNQLKNSRDDRVWRKLY